MKFKDARRTSFAIGDKVKILPSALDINVAQREIGKIVKIVSIHNPNSIMVTDSRGREYGYWCVNEYDIVPVIVVGQQLLFEFMQQS